MPKSRPKIKKTLKHSDVFGHYAGMLLAILVVVILASIFAYTNAYILSSLQKNNDLLLQRLNQMMSSSGTAGQTAVQPAAEAKPTASMDGRVSLRVSYNHGMACDDTAGYKIGDTPYWTDKETGEPMELKGAYHYWIDNEKGDLVGGIFFQRVAQKFEFKIPEGYTKLYQTDKVIVWTDIKQEMLPKNCRVWISLPTDFEL